MERPMTQRQLVSYCFYKLDPAWRLRSDEQKCADKQEFVEAVDRSSEDILIRAFSTVGTRGDCALLIWRAAEDVSLLNEAPAAINHTRLASYLAVPYHYLAMTRRSIYVTSHRHE